VSNTSPLRLEAAGMGREKPEAIWSGASSSEGD
jgi:hypothetical protein